MSLQLVFTSLLLVFHGVTSRHEDVTCLGGRREGDKWFDGCKWCMCMSGGPVCSPAKCSRLHSQVPPCVNYGSRWSDGCYHCSCRVDGIECRADPACDVLKTHKLINFQTNGACIEPRDERCVCGVDGVPSCSAEVIDRTTYQTTTIGLDANFYTQTPTVMPKAEYYYDLADKEDKTGKHHIYTVFNPFDFGHIKESRKKRSFPDKSNTFQTDAHTFLGDNKVPKIHSMNAYHQGLKRLKRSGKSENLGVFGINHEDNPSKLRHRHLKSRENGNRKLRRHESDFDDSLLSSSNPSMLDLYKSGKPVVHIPPPLLVASDNRCRFGPRWYSGGLRCFCSGVDGSITCGDPSFVATRIDGFRLEKIPCEQGHIWEERGSCRVCECYETGVVLCRRSPTCPLPFLMESDGNTDDGGYHIRSRDQFRAIDTSSETDEFSLDNDSVDHVIHEKDKTMDLTADSKHSSSIVVEDTKREMKKDYNRANMRRPKGSRRHRYPHRRFPKDNIFTKPHRPTHATLVKILECKPRSRWLDGCKRCHCNSHGRKHCDDSRCLKADLATMGHNTHINHIIDDSKRRFRPLQRPPAITLGRDRPINTIGLHPPPSPCGRFKPNQRYWVDCNLCRCTIFGPMCTAKSCG